MKEYVYKERTERNLPHRHSPNSSLFVTFRLAGSVPKAVLREYQAKKLWLEEEIKRLNQQRQKQDSPESKEHHDRWLEFHRQWFAKFEEVLHQEQTGPTWLKDKRIAQLVVDSLRHRDGQTFRLDTYCVMSNHVHILLTPKLSEQDLREEMTPEGLRFVSSQPPLSAIMHAVKGYSAHEANQVLNRKGQFWERESYDHEVRNDSEFARIVKYILNNPVKAGLVAGWRDWPWSFCREEFWPESQHESVL